MRDRRDFLHDLARVDRPGRVVRRQQQNAGDRIVVLDFFPNVIDVRHPPVVGVQVVRDVAVSRVCRLGRGVCAVSRRGPQDAGLTVEEAVHLRHGVAEAVEEHDFVWRNTDPVPPVDLLREEFACLRHALSVAVGPRRRLMHQVRNRVADPLRRDLSLLYRISDVLPRELDAQACELMGCDDDLADFVFEVRRAAVKEISTHGASAERLFERRGGVRRGVPIFHDDRRV